VTTPAGTTGTIFNPSVWVSFDPAAALPKRSLPLGSAFETPWEKIENFADNIPIDFANPQLEVDTRDHGVLFYMPAGGDGVSFPLVTEAPKWEHLLLSTGMQEFVDVAKAQVTTITMSGTATAGGTMLVNPGGITPVSIAIASADTAAAAAGKIAAGVYPGYAVAAVGAVVTFTAASAGSKGAPSVSGTPAGLTATAATPTEGVDEVTAGILNRFYQPRFRIIVEGFAAEGGLFPESQMVRLFFFRATSAEVGGGGGARGGGGGGGRRAGGGGGGGARGGGGGASPGSITAGWAGEGGHLRVALDIKALPDPGAAAALTLAGYPAPVQDPVGRFAWYNHKIAPVV
jgi:uncharacterized membrane protein YgcG